MIKFVFFVLFLQSSIFCTAHEATLVCLVNSFSAWTSKFTHTVPEQVLNLFKVKLYTNDQFVNFIFVFSILSSRLYFAVEMQTSLTAKSSTSGARAAYANSMWQTFGSDSIAVTSPLAPLLLALVDKASSNATQLPFLTEALAASRFIVKMAAKGACADVDLDKFWALITSQDKQLFTSEKFMTQASDESRLIAQKYC